MREGVYFLFRAGLEYLATGVYICILEDIPTSLSRSINLPLLDEGLEIIVFFFGGGVSVLN